MKVFNAIALTLVIVGALNWGLVGLFDFNLVAALFGLDSWLSALVYILVGAAGLWCVTLFGKLGRDPHTDFEKHGTISSPGPTATQPDDLRAQHAAHDAAAPPASARGQTAAAGSVPGEGGGTVPPRPGNRPS